MGLSGKTQSNYNLLCAMGELQKNGFWRDDYLRNPMYN